MITLCEEFAVVVKGFHRGEKERESWREGFFDVSLRNFRTFTNSRD